MIYIPLLIIIVLLSYLVILLSNIRDNIVLLNDYIMKIWSFDRKERKKDA